MKYLVKREHLGDRLYVEGEEREARPEEVAHLVANGVLQEKSAPTAINKARAKPKNKAK